MTVSIPVHDLKGVPPVEAWAIYQGHDRYFVRHLVISPSGRVTPRRTEHVSTLERARERVPPGTRRYPRDDGDEDGLVETWVALD